MKPENEVLKQALRVSEERFRALIENSCEGILLLDGEGTILYTSPADERIMGRTPEQSLGKSGFSWVHPDDLSAVYSAFHKLLESPGKNVTMELRARHEAGHWLWLECAARNLLHDPSVHGIVMNYHDVTERRLRDEDARLARDRFEIITRATQDVVWDWDATSNDLWWNEEFHSRFGYPKDIAATMDFWYDNIHPDDVDRIRNNLQDFLRGTENHWTGEYRFRRADGKWAEIWDRGYAIRDSSGKPVRMLGIILDISERRNVEIKVEKLAAFVRYNPNPAFEFSEDGQVTFCNEAAETLATKLGLPASRSILPEDHLDRVKVCLSSGKAACEVVSTVRERTFHWSFVPVAKYGVVHCYGTDVTEKIKLEEQLRQVSKMEGIGQLAGGVAHDFNNLLTVIQGHAALLTRWAEQIGDDLPQESLREIGLATDRAANLTRQLLTFSRKQVIQARDLDCNQVVSNILKMLQRLLGEDIQLQVTYASLLPKIHADPGMLEQTLVNLVVNARDAMPKGGKLSIQTAKHVSTAEYLSRNPDAAPGEAVCISIADTGCGIDPENLPRIFEPFFTTKEVGRGTGLGLATVYGIVKQHKGWIRVHSVLQEGTRFDIFLPALQTASKTAQPERRIPTSKKGRETILLVEDELPVRQLTKMVLEMSGYKVMEAPTGREALKVWQEHRDAIHLVLTDMVMPDGVTGRDLVRKIREDKPRTKAVYVSGYSTDVSLLDGDGAEEVTFLQKPFHPDELTEAIRKVLDGPAIVPSPSPRG